MMDESSFGSSEYSAEAEELFAQYLLARDVGEEVDFEAFAEEHEQWTEELFGLHTDWDNVRGLLGRLEQRRVGGATEQPPEADASGQPAPPASIEAAPDPSAEPRQASRGWPVTLGGLTVLLFGVGYLAFDFHREAEVNAKTSERLADEGAQTRRLLDASREEHSQLQGEHVTLAANLEAEREVRTQREQELAAEQLAVREAHAANARILSELNLEELRAEVLALSLRATVLRDADLLRSANLRGSQEPLEAWTAEVEDLLSRREVLTTRRDQLLETTPPPEPRATDLELELSALLEQLDGLETLKLQVAEELKLLTRMNGDLLDTTPAPGPQAVTLPQGMHWLPTQEGGAPRCRDLAIDFANPDLTWIEGEGLLLLTDWGEAQLTPEQELRASRLGYRRVGELEAMGLRLKGLTSKSGTVEPMVGPYWVWGSAR